MHGAGLLMQNWSGFYATIAAAAATLLGLLFVAISINAESLGPGHEDSRRLAEQGFQNYLAVLIIALVATFPGMSFDTLGVVAISVTVVASIWVLIRFWQSLRDAKARQFKGRASSVRRHAVSVLGFAMLIYSAFRMWSGDSSEDVPYIFASGLIVLVSSATVASWALLLRISRFKRPP
jgi:NADH:ubiquinone oxidoreductase subunit 6 (subunit J)